MTDAQLETLTRGCVEVIREGDLRERLLKKKRLVIKAGFDPTAPDLHLGHTVLLQKMKQFQDLGHDVVFLIGDFTGRIGDPTGKSETRKMLTDAEVEANAKTYREQVFKILDPKKTRIVFNSEWLNPLKPADFIRLTSSYTVARMLERDDFHKRFKAEQPISIHEFLYPLIQGYDSVVLKSDVELGGTDQKFNLIVGRELQKHYGVAPQIVMTLPLLVGTDGVNKMSKSLGNFIGLTEPPREIYGKVLSISDDLMWNYYELLSDLALDQIRDLREQVKSSQLHPKSVKMRLAWELTARFHDKAAADDAQAEFERVFSGGGVPDHIDEVSLAAESGGLLLVKVLSQSKLVASNSEAKRMISQHAVECDGEKVADDAMVLAPGQTYLLRVGKKRFLKVKIVSSGA